MTPSKPPELPTITTYLAVPQVPVDGSLVVPCVYYSSDFKHPVAFPLTSEPGSANPGLICIRQPSVEEAKRAHVDMLPDMKLYAAVAATLKEDLGLPTLFKASDELSIVFPMLDGTLRGVILVFSMIDQEKQTLQLWPTTDPVIKNGGDGC
jgi:hypothetical protein